MRTCVDLSHCAPLCYLHTHCAPLCYLHTQVQRAWMYLENIFIGSEDIRRQLPMESAMFEHVNAAYTHAMQRLHTMSNAVAATTADGVLAEFQVSHLKQQHTDMALSRLHASL